VFVRGFALVLCCAWAACSGEGSGERPSAQVEVQIGRKGGRVELDEVTLTIPEGALDKDLKLSVKEKADSSPVAHSKALSKVYEFGPAGTKFNKDVELQFKVERDEPGAAVFFTKEERPDQFEKLETTRDERGYVAKVKHFSAGFVGVDESPAQEAGADTDAGAAEEGGVSVELDAGAEAMDAGQPASEAGSVDAGGSDAGPGPTADASMGTPDAGSTPHVVLRTFDDVGTPANYTWAAFQDGTGSWQHLSPTTTAGTYQFDVKSGRYGVAVVCADAPGVNSRGVVRYATTAIVDVRIDIVITSLCRVGTPASSHTISGALMWPAGSYYYRWGHANGSLLNVSMSASTLFATAFLGGKLADLVVGVSSAQDGGLTRVMIVRDLMLSADLQRPFDFVNQGTSVGPTYSVLVSDASDSASLDVYYTTRGEGGGMPMRQAATSTPSAGNRLLTYASIPAGLTRSGDAYLIVARENDASGGRELKLRTNTAENHNLALPARFSANLDVETAPYLRPRASFTDYAGATQYKLDWGFFPSNETHSFDMLVDADYLAAPGTQTLTFPDLSAVSGFNSKWVPPAGTADAVNMSATAYTLQQNAGIEQKTSSTLAGTYRVVP
jgi:hypothetical protein